MQSKEVEILLQGFFWRQIILTTEIGDLVSVEADTWETDGTLPVGKVVALIVRELTESVKRHAGVVSDDKVLGWGDSTNGNLVRDQKELEVVASDTLVDHRSWLWVVTVVEEESVIDSLVDEDFGEFWLAASTVK